MKFARLRSSRKTGTTGRTGKVCQWRNWKAHLNWQENMNAPPRKLALPKVNNRLTDLKADRDVAAQRSWVAALTR